MGKKHHFSSVSMVISMAFIIFVACVASAAPYSRWKGEDNLTLKRCIDIALKNNPSFLATQKTVEAKAYKQRASFKKMLPSFKASMGAISTYKDMGAYSYSGEDYWLELVVSQPVYRGGALYKGWKRADIVEEQAKLDRKRRAQRLVYDIKRAWYDVLRYIALVKEAEDALKRLRKHARNARIFYREGWVWRTDVLQAEVEVAQGEQDLIETKNRLNTAIATLNTLLHRPIDATVATGERLEFVRDNWTWDKLKRCALSARPEIKKAILDVKKAEIDTDIAKANMLPKADILASFKGSSDRLSFDSAITEEQVVLSVSWPFWEWGKTIDDTRESLRYQERARLLLEDIKDNIMLDVQSAWFSFSEAEKRLNVLKKSLRQAEENYRVNQVKYRERLGTANDLIYAQSLLSRTKKDWINALASYLTALARLEYSIGSKLNFCR